jgi:hypothetical protein
VLWNCRESVPDLRSWNPTRFRPERLLVAIIDHLEQFTGLRAGKWVKAEVVQDEEIRP